MVFKLSDARTTNLYFKGNKSTSDFWIPKPKNPSIVLLLNSKFFQSDRPDESKPVGFQPTLAFRLLIHSPATCGAANTQPGFSETVQNQKHQ